MHSSRNAASEARPIRPKRQEDQDQSSESQMHPIMLWNLSDVQISYNKHQTQQF